MCLVATDAYYNDRDHSDTLDHLTTTLLILEASAGAAAPLSALCQVDAEGSLPCVGGSGQAPSGR